MFMLSGTCVLYAQTPQTEEGTEATPAAKVAKTATKKAPKYKMKEISGYIFDGATKKPVVGAQIQSLGNSYYSAITDESGKYTIRVPEFVEVWFSAHSQSWRYACSRCCYVYQWFEFIEQYSSASCNC